MVSQLSSVTIGGRTLRKRKNRDGALGAALPGSKRRQKTSKKAPIAPPQNSSDDNREEELQMAQHDLNESLRIGHERASDAEHTSGDNVEPRQSEATGVSTARSPKTTLARDSNHEPNGKHLELQKQGRHMILNDQAGADRIRDSGPGASGAENNDPATDTSQALAELLQKLREIGSMDFGQTYNFFTEWTISHSGRDVGEWLDFYQKVVKPTFYRDKEWEEYIDANREERGMIIGEARLRESRSVMLKLVGEGTLETGRPPREFLEVQSWEDAIRDSSNKQRTIALRDRMLQDFMAERIHQPQDFDTYLWQASWQMASRDAKDDQQATRIEEQRQNMIDGVVQAGEMPCSFEDWFKASEWSEYAERFPGERVEIRRMEEQMMENVLHGGAAPYGASWLFRAPEWNRYIEEAEANQGEKRSWLWGKSRACVYDDWERRCMAPARARWAAGWNLLCSRLESNLNADVSQIGKERSIVDKYSEFEPEELIMPPSLNGETIAIHALNLVKKTVKLEKAKFDIAEWNKRKRNAQPAEKERLIQQFAKMQRAFVDNDLTYRPEEIPEDRVGVAKEIGYDGSQPGLWCYKGELGAGAYGTATLWVQLDAQARYINRQALKDTYLDGDRWDHAGYWAGNINSRIPLEFEIVTQLKALPGSDNIVEYHETKAYAERKMYRIYMEYAEHGTLQDLIEGHREAQALQTAEGTAVNWRISPRLLWCIFEGLALALCLAHQGRLPENTHRLPKIVPVIDRDVEPANILLAALHADVWPELPTVKLADWGLVVPKSTGDHLTRRGGTAAWMAPEVLLYEGSDHSLYGHYEPSEASDIWALGRVMLALANLDKANVEPFRFGMTPPTYGPGVQDAMPPQMVALIDECLKSEPKNRIRCDFLWKDIQAEVATFSGPFGQPLKMKKREEDELLLYQYDKYRAWGR